MSSKYQPAFLLISILLPAVLQAQDSVIFKNDQYLVGEIKGMSRAVLTMETEFSDQDFQIEWDKVQEIYTQSEFLISLEDGRQYNGDLQGIAPDSITLNTNNFGAILVKLIDIVYLEGIGKGFKDRFKASIDIGFSIAKANSLRQFSSRSNLGYNARRWGISANYNSILSTQDDQEDTERTDAGITFTYILQKGWYLFPELLFLSNTEQRLSLRTSVKLGAGKYLVRSNKSYWSVLGGFSHISENFSTEEPNRNSQELFLGTELNLYDIGDFNLLLKATAFPSITENGRWRTDVTLDFKYDLPLDFYIKIGTTLNYDNQPVEGGTELDYVIQNGIGWEF